MRWNPESGYLEYKMSLDDLKRRLGLGVVDFEVRPKLAPYLTRIIQYLDKQIIMLGDNPTTIDVLNKFFECFDHGADLIVALLAGELAEEVGIFIDDAYYGDIEQDWDPTEGPALDREDNAAEGPALDDGEDHTDKWWIDYEQDRFIFCWTNVMSCLKTRLMIQYASLLEEPTGTGCNCCCGEGEDWKSWETYSSGVYPEDEEYFDSATSQNTSVWSTIPRHSGNCTCGYRPSGNS